MPTMIQTNRSPAPVVKDDRLPVKWTLQDHNGTPVTRFPVNAPQSTLRIVRFVPPSFANPEGLLVAVGHPPFKPSVIGFTLVREY